MVTLNFVFPVEKDGHLFRKMLVKLFENTFLDEKNEVTISPVTKRDGIWLVTLSILDDSNDNVPDERLITITGGTFNVVNRDKELWAFSI